MTYTFYTSDIAGMGFNNQYEALKVITDNK